MHLLRPIRPFWYWSSLMSFLSSIFRPAAFSYHMTKVSFHNSVSVRGPCFLVLLGSWKWRLIRSSTMIETPSPEKTCFSRRLEHQIRTDISAFVSCRMFAVTWLLPDSSFSLVRKKCRSKCSWSFSRVFWRSRMPSETILPELLPTEGMMTSSELFARVYFSSIRGNDAKETQDAFILW